MIESLDFTLGIILGVAITFLGNYVTEKWRERKDRKSVATALIRELKGIKRFSSDFQPYKIITSVFSAIIPKLLLFEEQTIDSVLEIYNEINWTKERRGMESDEIGELVKRIDNCNEIIKKELDC